MSICAIMCFHSSVINPQLSGKTWSLCLIFQPVIYRILSQLRFLFLVFYFQQILTNWLLRLWIFLQSFIVNMILITTLSSIEMLLKMLQIILHLYEIRSLTISIIYIFAPPCPKTTSLLFCFDVKLIWIWSSEFCRYEQKYMLSLSSDIGISRSW